MTHILNCSARRGALAATFALAMIQAAPAHDYKAGDLEIGHPWSREAPLGAKVAGGYVTVTNNGATPDRLVGAGGEIAGKTEIHDMSVDANGVMTMRELGDGVEIPAGGSVELKPGGKHIMFMELNRVPKDGEAFKGVLTFEKAGPVEVEFHVEKVKPGQRKDDHSAHGASHGG